MTPLLERIEETLGGSSPRYAVDLPADELFTVVRNERRRRAIVALLEEFGGRAQIGELAEHIARAENGLGPDAEISGPPRKTVYVCLHQSHLPVDDADVVDWEENGTVRATANTRGVRDVIERGHEVVGEPIAGGDA